MTKAEIIKTCTGCYNINLYDNHGKFCFSLPDNNWYTKKELKVVIDNAGFTCLDFTRLTDFDKKILGVI